MTIGTVNADLQRLLDRLPRPEASWFVRPDGEDGSAHIHGVSHTQRVMIHALEVAEALDAKAWQREAVLRAALWHDIGRTDDGRDYYHGAKSAGKVVGLGLHRGLPPLIAEMALYAVTHHSGDEQHGVRAAKYFPDSTSALLVFQILKDADGLDRVRLGNLDASYLRLAPSPGRERRARELLESLP